MRDSTALICNIGDSRVYRLTASGELRQCTLDDSIFGGDWELQRHLGEVVVPTGLIEHVYLAQRHVIDRVLGEGLHAPNRWTVALEDDDVVVAVTDGVSDNLTFSELREVVGASRDDPARGSTVGRTPHTPAVTRPLTHEQRSTTSPRSSPAFGRMRRARDSVQGVATVGPLRLSQTTGQCGEQLLGQRRHLVEHRGEALVVEHVQPAVADGADRCGSWPAVEDGQLAEMVTLAELGDRLTCPLHGRLAVGEQEEVAAHLTLVADDVSGRGVGWVHDECDAVQLRGQEPGEQRHISHELLELRPFGHEPTLVARKFEARRFSSGDLGAEVLGFENLRAQKPFTLSVWSVRSAGRVYTA